MKLTDSRSLAVSTQSTLAHALALDPRDPWAVHAVQHVFEMQGRVQGHAVAAGDFAELGGQRAFVPQRVAPGATPPRARRCVAATVADFGRGGDVGDRWQALADCRAAQDEDGFYAFNDVHALIAYTAAARDEHQRRMLAKLEKSADGVHTNAIITRELGLPLARAIVAMASRHHAEAVELLLPVRSRMNRIGGNHAQRDLVQLTCNEAALRCGNGRLARARGTPPDWIGKEFEKETVMFVNFLYRGLPTSVLLAAIAFVQYYAIRAFV